MSEHVEIADTVLRMASRTDRIKRLLQDMPVGTDLQTMVPSRVIADLDDMAAQLRRVANYMGAA